MCDVSVKVTMTMMMMTTAHSPVQQGNMPVPIIDERRRLEEEEIPAALTAEVVAHLHSAVDHGHHQVIGAYVWTFVLDEQYAILGFGPKSNLEATTALT